MSEQTSETTQTDPTAGATEETKRDRVRRLFLDPLEEAGFRFRRGTEPDKARAALIRMADGLAYLSDEALVALRVSMMTKGEGTARCFWPCYATVIGYAEAFERRPLEDLPELVRWFRSQAGQEAAQAGRLVAEFKFWEDRKRPPVSPSDKARVASRAQEWADQAERIRDRLGRGLSAFGGDAEWLAWYDATEARARALLAAPEGAA